MVRPSAKYPVCLLCRLIFTIDRHNSCVLLRDHDLIFQGHKFETLVSRKLWELSQNFIIIVKQVDIRHRTASLWMYCSPTLTFIFIVKHFVMHLLWKKCAGSGCPRQIGLDSHSSRRGVALIQYLTRLVLIDLLHLNFLCQYLNSVTMIKIIYIYIYIS